MPEISYSIDFVESKLTCLRNPFREQAGNSKQEFNHADAGINKSLSDLEICGNKASVF